MNLAKPITKIVMRTGNTYTIPGEKGQQLQEQLATLSQHMFIRIPSLGVTINTADVAEVLNDVEKVHPEDEPEVKRTSAEQAHIDKMLAKMRAALYDENGKWKHHA